ncbi:MAG: HTH domain-containing protein [Clostridia bacterium]|nr:HTH domain-containing protein [Clostridia bacterium]
MGTAERRLEIMKLLCKHRYETMANLAQEFGVSIRTIKRDIDELTFLMPLYVKGGRYGGGIYVSEDYTMDRIYMKEEEINLLVKVRELVSDKLSENENNLFECIIKSYSKIFI